MLELGARISAPRWGSRPGINESLRWVKSYAHLVGLAPQLPQTRLVCVGDRESDMLALFERGQRGGWAVDLLVRARHDRVLPDKQAGKLWDRVMASEVLGRIRFDMPSGRGRKARPVVWKLLTNRPVHTLEQAVELVDWYRARREIELLFWVLKEGCRVGTLAADAH